MSLSTYVDNSHPKLKKRALLFWGLIYIGHIASLSTFFIGHMPFFNIFLNILTALCRVYIRGPRNVGPKIWEVVLLASAGNWGLVRGHSLMTSCIIEGFKFVWRHLWMAPRYSACIKLLTTRNLSWILWGLLVFY